MTSATAERTWTIEDLDSLDEPERYELVCGRLREIEMSQVSDEVAALLMGQMAAFARANRLGVVTAPGTGVPTNDDEIKLPRPDGTFTRKSRLPGGQASRGNAPVPPDIAVEIVSTHENAGYLQKKVRVYLALGIRLVWIVYPEEREVMVYRADGSVSRVREPDQLSGEDVLPGFICDLASFLPEREPAPEGAP